MDLITPDEIKILRDGAITITLDGIIDAAEQNKLISVEPIKLKSGYLVSMTFNKLLGRTAEHVSVSKNGGTDPADAEIIAKAIIGDGCTVRKGLFNKNIIHFIKILR